MIKDALFVPSNEGETLAWEMLHLTDKLSIESCICSLKDMMYRGYPSVLTVWNALIKTNNDQAATARSGLKLLIKICSERENENPQSISVQTVSLQLLAMLSCYRNCALGMSSEKGFPDSLFSLLSRADITSGDKECCIWIVRRMVEVSSDLCRKIGLNTRAMTQIFTILRERIAAVTDQDEIPRQNRRASTAMQMARKPAAPELVRRPLSTETSLRPAAAVSAAEPFTDPPADGLRISQPHKTLRLAALPETRSAEHPRGSSAGGRPALGSHSPAAAARPQRPSTALRSRAFAATSPQLNPRPPSAPTPPPLRGPSSGPPRRSIVAASVDEFSTCALARGGGGAGAGGARPWSGVSAQSAAQFLAGGGGGRDEPLRLEGNCAAALAALAMDGVAAERQAQRADVGEWVAALAWLLRHGGGSAQLHACRCAAAAAAAARAVARGRS